LAFVTGTFVAVLSYIGASRHPDVLISFSGGTLFALGILVVLSSRQTGWWESAATHFNMGALQLGLALGAIGTAYWSLAQALRLSGSYTGSASAAKSPAESELAGLLGLLNLEELQHHGKLVERLIETRHRHPPTND
jgi:hypothetical protein